MKTHRIRNLVVIPVLILFVVSVLAANISAPALSSLPAAGPQMMAAESEELEAQWSAPAGPPTYDIKGPFAEEHAAGIPFDKDLRDLPQIGPAEKRPMRELLTPADFSAAGSEGPDMALQTIEAVEAMPGATVSFKGLDLNTWGAGWPPDTNGDVGPSHYIQTVNTSIGIYDKTGALITAFTFDTLMNGIGTPCDATNMGDPIVLYDRYSGRWIITDFAWASTRGPFYECIAVSKTGDPVSGGWWFYALTADSLNLNDYPKLGVWPDGIYMSANMFKRARTFAGVKVWAINREALISGQPLRTVAFTLGTAYASLLPANILGSTQPPTPAPAFFASIYAPSTLRLWKFTVNWTTPTASTFTGPTAIPVTSYSNPTFRIPQLGSTETLDTLGGRLMMQLQYRNIGGVESLWVNHTVVSNNVAGVRWYEVRNLRTTPTVYQQGTYQPDSNHRWMGALAVDNDGNMAVGYSVSSSAMYPAIRYAGRLATDPLGALSQGETTLIAGTGSQLNGYNRWGDYSSMSIDPVDDCTFWYTTEYYETTGNNWQTRVGSFKFPSCTP